MNKPKRFYRHMTPAIAKRIREKYFSRQANQAELAREFEISQGSVSRIISNQSWIRE